VASFHGAQGLGELAAAQLQRALTHVQIL